MKKILVILALMFSSMFANCANDAVMYFKYIGRHYMNLVYIDAFENRGVSKEDIERMLTDNSIIETVKRYLDIAYKDRYYNSYNYLNSAVKEIPKTIIKIFKEGMDEVNDSVTKNLNNGKLNKNNVEETLYGLEEYLKEEAISYTKKLNNCYFH